MNFVVVVVELTSVVCFLCDVVTKVMDGVKGFKNTLRNNQIHNLHVNQVSIVYKNIYRSTWCCLCVYFPLDIE